MEYSEFQALFCKILQENGMEVPDEATVQAFYHFDCELHRVNAVTNLTAIRNTPDAIVKHYADSLMAAKYIPYGARVLDIGCGPGFPSIPLAIYRKDLTVIGLDSTAKKIGFVNGCAKLLELSNLSAISGRADDAQIAAELGKFDVVVSRAVARLNVLCELCLPYVKIGGFLLAMKASKAEEEATEAKRCIEVLGGANAKLHNEMLRAGDVQDPRCLIEIEKIKKCPAGYPRAYAQILKKPL